MKMPNLSREMIEVMIFPTIIIIKNDNEKIIIGIDSS